MTWKEEAVELFRKLTEAEQEEWLEHLRALVAESKATPEEIYERPTPENKAIVFSVCDDLLRKQQEGEPCQRQQ